MKNKAVRRALALITCLCLCAVAIPVRAAVLPFTDVAEVDWFAP